MNTCKLCDRQFVYSRKAGHTKDTCNSCHVNKRRTKVKQRAIEYKGAKCYSCGFDKYPSALDFHHLDPTKKDFNISGNHSRKWEVIQEELDKCVMLCSNCHRALHFGELTIDWSAHSESNATHKHL